MDERAVTRFDNLSIDELRVQHATLLAEAELILATMERKMRADCRVKEGKVYDCTMLNYRGDPLPVRRFYVQGLTWNYQARGWRA